MDESQGENVDLEAVHSEIVQLHTELAHAQRAKADTATAVVFDVRCRSAFKTLLVRVA